MSDQEETKTEDHIFEYDYYEIKKICRKLNKYENVMSPYKLTINMNLRILLVEHYVDSITFDISYGGKYKIKIDFTSRKSHGILYSTAVQWAVMVLRLPITKKMFDIIQDDCFEWAQSKTYEQIRKYYQDKDTFFQIGDCLHDRVYIKTITGKDYNIAIVTQSDH
jgi:hypothetical protein